MATRTWVFLLTILFWVEGVFGQSITPVFFKADSREQVRRLAAATLETFALVVPNDTRDQLQIYRYFPDSTSSDNDGTVLNSTGAGKWHRISLSTASGSGSGGSATNAVAQFGGSATNLTQLGVGTRDDQYDYLVTDVTSSTGITLNWTNATAFINLAHNTTIGWADYPTSTTRGRDFVLWLTNSGSFTCSFGTINSKTIKWRTDGGTAPTLPANSLSRFLFTWDRTNYWGEVDTGQIAAGQVGTGVVDDTEFAFLDGVSAPLVTTTGTQTLTKKIYARDASALSDDTYEGDVVTGYNAGEGLSQWDVVYLSSSSTWLKADADAAGKFPAVGVVVATTSNGAAATVLTRGVFRDDGGTAWTAGGTLFLSATAGGLTQTAPTTSGHAVHAIGTAITNHRVQVNVGPVWFEN